MAGTVIDKGNGSYKLSYMYKSKRYYETVEARTLTEARLLLAQFVLDIRNGVYFKSSKLTFEQFAAIYLKDYAYNNLCYESQNKTVSTLVNWFLPKLATYKLEDLTPQVWSNYFSWLSEQISPTTKRKLAKTTIERFYAIICSMYNFAIKNELTKTNTISDSRANTRKTKEMLKKQKVAHVKERCLTYEEAFRLIDALNEVDLKYQLIVHFGIAGGLRRSEILGIKWSDIDFDKCTVSICQSSLQVCNVGYVEGDLKNTYSHRKIYMPKTTIELLKDYRKESLKYNKDGDFVFVNNRGCRKGLRLCPGTVTRWFREFRKSIKLPDEVPLHGLRHTSATILIAEGVNIKSVSSRLGHSNTNTTLDVYSHALTEVDRSATDDIESFLFEDMEAPQNSVSKRYTSKVKISKLKEFKELKKVVNF